MIEGVFYNKGLKVMCDAILLLFFKQYCNENSYKCLPSSKVYVKILNILLLILKDFFFFFLKLIVSWVVWTKMLKDMIKSKLKHSTNIKRSRATFCEFMYFYNFIH